MKELTTHRWDGDDWRAPEAKLNQYPWFTVTVDRQELRLIHHRGKGPDAIPRCTPPTLRGFFTELTPTGRLIVPWTKGKQV
jgi:hypothetical protein